jgi:hypothetical protein
MSRQQAALAAKLPALMNNNQIEIRRESGSDQARVEQDGKRVLKLGLDLPVATGYIESSKGWGSRTWW